MYANVKDGQIVALGHYPDVEWDGERWWDLRDSTIRTDRGWHKVIEVNRPADTATHTYVMTYEIVNGTPTQVWTAVVLSTEETAFRSRQVNLEQTATKLATIDFPAMQAILDQTNAAIKTDPSQEIKDLARAVRRLVRKVESLLDGSE